MTRLKPIEGLRAYLAFWVLIGHTMVLSGYPSVELSWLPHIFLCGIRAVEIFMIISGFVIFSLLDKKHENYLQFILRRFFRLWPLFVLLFVASLPLSFLASWNINHSPWLTKANAAALAEAHVGSWWQNVAWHIPAHLTMMHGVVPQGILPYSPGAFLGPAWSISLEWQFYLCAPLAYAALARGGRSVHRIGCCVLVLGLSWSARHILPEVELGAFLPFHVDFFFLGAVCYFVYDRASYVIAERINDFVFPVGFVVATFFLTTTESSWKAGNGGMYSICLWLIFLALMADGASSICGHLVMPLFTNKAAQLLGRISYGIYLSHLLVIYVVDYCLISRLPRLTQSWHFIFLFLSTTAFTVILASVLYRLIEKPGIAIGGLLASKMSRRSEGHAVVVYGGDEYVGAVPAGHAGSLGVGGQENCL